MNLLIKRTGLVRITTSEVRRMRRIVFPSRRTAKLKQRLEPLHRATELTAVLLQRWEAVRVDAIDLFILLFIKM